MITDEQIHSAALQGLRDQLRNMLSRSEYGPGKRLEQLVSNTIEANQAVIESHIQKAMVDALLSSEFVERLRAEMLQAMAKKFTGAFDGVMRAAGKKLAQDRLTRDSIVVAVRRSCDQPTQSGP